MKKIYFLSGLGADYRIFNNLKLPGFELIFLEWLSPIENEPMSAYSWRMSELIKDVEPIIVGMSFGGIMGIEISKWIDFKKLFLISSITSFRELPRLYRLAGQLNLHKLVPVSAYKGFSNALTFWLFGISDSMEKELFKEIARDSVDEVYCWAVNAVVKWRHINKIANLVRIHGSDDHVLPIAGEVDFVIQAGGHFMVHNRAREISELISSELAKEHNSL